MAVEASRSAINVNNAGICCLYLGRFLKNEERYSEAEDLFRQALSIWEWHFGKDNENYLRTAANLQTVLEAQDKLDSGPQ